MPKLELTSIALILTLFGVAIAAQRSDHPVDSPKLVECAPDEATKARVRDIMVHGLDLALQDRVTTLFEIWMKDDSGQPDRARVGIEQGIDAYLHARKGFLKWDLPVCK